MTMTHKQKWIEASVEWPGGSEMVRARVPREATDEEICEMVLTWADARCPSGWCDVDGPGNARGVEDWSGEE